MIRKIVLHLLGYKTEFTHPQQVNADTITGRKRAYLDCQIAKFRDHFCSKQLAAAPVPPVAVEARVTAFVDRAYAAVDRAFYAHGLS